MGEAAIRNLGELIQTGPNRNGFYALRAASILSAADPEGLSLTGFLRHFPTPNIRINLPLALNLIAQASKFVDATDKVGQAIDARSQAEARTEGPVNLATLPPLPTSGPYQFAKRTLMLEDSRRNRPIPTDLYVPNFQGNMPASIPVVVFSHGLGETREFTAPFMEYLAANGFVVAAPEHIGSDKGQQERLLFGTAREFFKASEFYDRPQDVSFVLDTLEQNNQTEFGGRLNLKQVGVYGHSFGGYTVLVLGGATVDFKRLHQECEKDYVLQSLNNSLLLQCRAREVESSPQAELLSSGKLQDPRVKFVMAISPVTNAILGPSGLSRIQLPVTLFGGGYDPVAPLVPEQTDAFVWLTTPDKYLVTSNVVSHTPEITEVINRLVLPAKTTDELDEKLDNFLKNFRGLGLAFMQVYAAGRSDYRPYLQSSYVKSLNVPPFNFALIRSFPADQLNQLMRKAGL
jgi:predicted dienelactone hydrolase